MSRVVVSTEVETWQTDPPSPDYGIEPYEFRGGTGGRVSNVTAYIEQSDRQQTYYGDSCGKDLGDIRPGDRIYAVFAGYTSGDTFGHDGGQTQVLDVFRDSEEAAELARVASAVKDDYRFEHNGVSYYASWVGYFEHLDEMNVWEVVVRGVAKDPYSRDSNPGYKIGH